GPSGHARKLDRPAQLPGPAEEMARKMGSTPHPTNAAPPGAETATTVPTTPPAATISLQNATTARDTFKNPLNDPAIATVLTQVNNSSIATSEQFNLEREFAIYVPKK